MTPIDPAELAVFRRDLEAPGRRPVVGLDAAPLVLRGFLRRAAPKVP